MSRPLRSTTTPASSGFTATTSRSASERLNRYSMPPVAAVGTLPLAARRTDPQARTAALERSLSHVPCKSRRPGSRRLNAGHHLANNRGQPPGSSRERRCSPVSMPSDLKFRRLNNDPQPGRPKRDPGPGALERLPGPHLTRSRRAFSLSLTTTVFSQRSTGWFDAYPRRADAGGPTSLHLSHSTTYEELPTPSASFDVRDTHPLPKFAEPRIASAASDCGYPQSR